MNIRPPRLQNKSQLAAGNIRSIVSEATIEQTMLQGMDMSLFTAKNLSFDECILEKVLFMEAKLEKLGFLDCELKACDMSAAYCASASLMRTRIVGGRLTGIDFSRSTLKDVVFQNCKLDMANFRYAKLTRVRFADCILTDTDFLAAELSHVTFEASQLDKTAFSGGKIDDVDFRSSQLVDVRGWQYLKGATIDAEQLVAIAPQLAVEMGLKVQD